MQTREELETQVEDANTSMHYWHDEYVNIAKTLQVLEGKRRLIADWAVITIAGTLVLSGFVHIAISIIEAIVA